MEAEWSAREARQLGYTDCVVRRCWDQRIREIDEYRFNLSSDDNHFRVGRPRSKHFKPVFALEQHTAPTAGGMVWVTIANNTGLPLVLIRGTMTAQRYVHDIHVLPPMTWLPGTIFQHVNARPHTARVSQDCIHMISTLPWPAHSPDLSPMEHIWDHIVRPVGHRTSLNELEARLQQIWNEMSQYVIKNFFASMTDRLASCICARGGSTVY
ncbi:transposable element Tcb1 transposase [Trichonephila clavipes]|nr:transposable element Tcb1 transposase [Trichonephila clavipes]